MENSNIENLQLSEAEELENFKKTSDILTRDISRRLDEINSHINAVDLALESIIDIYNEILEEHDEIALVTLIRIANKYKDQFENWAKFISEDIEMVSEITQRFSKETDFL